MTDQQRPRYAETEEDANERYETYRSIDPFPSIAPALLNSADIADYVAATGMIFPFDQSELKPASYGVRLGGKCVYWNDDGQKKVVVLTTEKTGQIDGIEHTKEITIRRNSIVFVSLEPSFRLPEYIALRFNLKIKNVYRGLLLGTGPLVDPGFKTRLSFPLHNLTNEEYTLRAGEIFIYLEFTKVSAWQKWYPDKTEDSLGNDLLSKEGTYSPFPDRKLTRKDIDDYLHHANSGRAVQSSIPVVLRSTEEAAAKSAESAEAALGELRDARRSFAIGALIAGGISLVSVVVGIGGVVYEGYQLLQDSRVLAGDLRSDIDSTRRIVNQVAETLDSQNAELRTEINSLKDEIEKVRNSTDSNSESNEASKD